MTTTLNARIDAVSKQRAKKILDSLGLTMSGAIEMYFQQIILQHGIPFEIKLPNKATTRTFRKTDSGKDLHRVSNIRQLRKELRS